MLDKERGERTVVNSVTKSCLTLQPHGLHEEHQAPCHYLPELAQIHVN